jgi:4-amino-4-deoxy-L-arabinose transferase-like glycosyltransferase
LAGLAGLILRLFFVFRFPAVVDDSRLYANIADNWLHHGVYAITNSGVVMPTLSRLPGYPAFLAGVFLVFGDQNFRAALLIQVLLDLITCVLIADLARRLFSERAARAAFLLAALCPFLANYAATALTESLEIFFTTLALDLALRALQPDGRSQGVKLWLGCGFSIGGAILLRPDGGILLVAVLGFLLWLLLRGHVAATRLPVRPRALVAALVLTTIGAFSPLIPWTFRNLHTLHRFEPLAPRYANDADEPNMVGFNRWVKTWMAEYVSVEEIYWNMPGDQIDPHNLPDRAFDSATQRAQTEALFSDYNRNHDLTPELDARFSELASQRIRNAPLRYYLWLPALRIADMWFRPRTELFPSDPRWWELNDDAVWLSVSLGFGAINVLYIAGAAAGFIHLLTDRPRETIGIGLFVLFLLLRSAFLGTVENPEPRYTLECYPVVILLVSALFNRR